MWSLVVTQQVLSSGQWANNTTTTSQLLHIPRCSSSQSPLCLLLLFLSSNPEAEWKTPGRARTTAPSKWRGRQERSVFSTVLPVFPLLFPAQDSNHAAPAGHQAGRREWNQGLNQELHCGPGDKDWREGGENHHWCTKGGVWWRKSLVRQRAGCQQASHRIYMRIVFFFWNVLTSRFPCSFIGEESVAKGEPCILSDKPTWIIDPVDGTTNFVHG